MVLADETSELGRFSRAHPEMLKWVPPSKLELAINQVLNMKSTPMVKPNKYAERYAQEHLDCDACFKVIEKNLRKSA